MFRTEVTSARGIPLIRVFGNLDIEAVSRFDTVVQDTFADEAVTDLALDLTHSHQIDSAGLGSLVKSHKRCQLRGGGLKLFGLDEKVAKLIGITHLNELFEIHPDLISFLGSSQNA